jgi:hypothetical protein
MMIVIIVIIVIIVVMIIVVMIIVVMIIVVMIIVVMIMMIIVRMNNAIKVLCLTPNQRRSYSSFYGQAATRTKSPLENSTKQSIERVMLRVVFEVIFKSPVTLKSDYRGEIKFTSFRDITTPTMGTVGQ